MKTAHLHISSSSLFLFYRAALDQLIFPRAKPNTFRRILWTLIIWVAAVIVSITVARIDGMSERGRR